MNTNKLIEFTKKNINTLEDTRNQNNQWILVYTDEIEQKNKEIARIKEENEVLEEVIRHLSVLKDV